MLQSSITAWLKKPAASRSAPPPAAPPAVPSSPDGPPATAGEAPRQSLHHAFSLPPLPSNVELAPLTPDLVPDFKRLNALTLPVPYPNSFYVETMTEPHHSITLMALWHSLPAEDAPKPRLIGAIRCRLLPAANLYISTIALLSPYRSHGIATHLLQRIMAKASEEHGVQSVTAHVWEANDEGLEWYKKRGFDVLGREEGYYRKLRPTGAILVRKQIRIGDLLGHSKTTDEHAR